jgi:predicted permease
MPHLKFALRMLFRAPLITSVAILSLGLGIGATTAIFSIYNRILLRPLPVAAPEALVNLTSPGIKAGSTSCNNAGGCDEIFSYPMFRDLEAGQTVFTGLAAHRSFDANLAFDGLTAKGVGMLVSGSYFPVLGVAPAAGRLLDGGDDRVPGGSAVVVLGHAYWEERFARRSDVLGRPLSVNGQPMTIVGVAPRGFESTTVGTTAQVFVPITMRGLMQPTFRGFENRRIYWAYLFGRLKPGTTIEQARAGINQIYRPLLTDVEAPLQQGMSAARLAEFKAKEIGVEPGARGQSDVLDEAFVPLAVLLGTTAVVLLSACANIANLLLARATSRAAEMAVRVSIGAARRHLVGQLLAESLLLAALGGAAGLFVAHWTLAAIAAMLPAEAAALVSFSIDGRLMAFVAAIVAGTGVLFGVFPALQASRPDLAGTLKGAAGQPGGSRAARWFRAGLATFQILLSTALLCLAGLFARSLYNVSHVDLGLAADNVITFGISPELSRYAPARSHDLFVQFEEELAAIPGVSSVTAALVPILAGSNWGTNVSVEGFRADPDTDTNARFNRIGPGYFGVLGVPLITGREFTAKDGATSPKVAIVNEAFVQKFQMGRHVVGRRMAVGGTSTLDIEIVGLVKNAKYSDVKDAVPPLFFTPYRQDDQLGTLTYYARTAVAPDTVLAAIPGLAQRLDPGLPVENLRTLPQQVRENVFLDRFVSLLSAAFAALATVLAAVGLYGVMAYAVVQRTREFGLRLALGADPARVRWLVLRQVGAMTLVGTSLGIGLALAGGAAAGSLLFGLEGHDPVVLASATALLAAIALAAGLIPANRASRVDPMHALRYE